MLLSLTPVKISETYSSVNVMHYGLKCVTITLHSTLHLLKDDYLVQVCKFKTNYKTLGLPDKENILYKLKNESKLNWFKTFTVLDPKQNVKRCNNLVPSLTITMQVQPNHYSYADKH